MKKFLKNLNPNIVLNDITQLTPQLMREQNLEGVIFDLDDTLMPERSGKFSEEIVECLKTLKENGFKTGIITNNFSSKYCETVRNLLEGEDLFIPMIENAYKPDVLCFQQMVDFFELPAFKVAMIGDGIFTDTLGAHKMGMFAIRVRWFSKSNFKRGFWLSLRELIVCSSDLIRRFWFGHKTKQYNMVKNTSEKNYLFLINPKSGQENMQQITELIENTFANLPNKTNYKIHECKEFGKLNELFSEDIKKHNVIVAVGGDGTVREAISLIKNNWADISLGVIPTGTGNLFAKSLNIPSQPLQALETILLGKTKKVSLAKANNHYLALCAGAGIDANVMKLTTSEKKKALGIWAYCVEAAKQVLSPKETRLLLNIDGKRVWTRGIGVLAINRNSYIQAFLPQLNLENEKERRSLDICVLKPQQNFDYITALVQLFSNQYKGSLEPIQYFEGRNLKIFSWPALNVQVDGDYIGKTPLKVEFLYRRLTVLIP